MVDSVSPVTLPVMLQGRYRMGAIIGRGGASAVYRARDLLLGRDVAVKVFSTRAVDAEDLRAQEGEARILAGFNHPGLVTLLDAGVDLTDPAAPQVFLVMELVPNADLRERLRRGALDAFEVTYLGWDLLDALDYVHERGIIHRDLKPANVLLIEARNRPPRGKLADFGIAVLRGHSSDDEPETTTGTAAYLSPEQVEGGGITPATDIYSLGLVLLEAYSGRVTFPGGVLESAFARLDEDPPIPAEMPDDLAEVLRRMTARRPADRPSAKDALADFREIIMRRLGGGRPQAADPEAERLAAVRDLNLIGTPPDAEFDRITALAARLFEVPVAVISIVDENRVWLKSRRGIDVAEVERTRGLGASGSLQEATLVIEDVANDPRTANLPDSGASPYRFYAGVPLITREGHNIGVIAIADVKPRRMSASEVATLEDLAAMALHEMELRRAARRAALGQLQLPDDGRG
ncbi:MAG TPA: GAF domain-containing serine/threonine-protein kinase [Amnibacterium sp.]|uniref:GAF domain-containing serine/threonine-protein kinase n=1 Tax=Amnibacterium sp. TaxID=1872496 RepID=UPI002F92AB29